MQHTGEGEEEEVFWPARSRKRGKGEKKTECVMKFSNKLLGLCISK
jgi:hypothetical protein